MPHLHEIDVTTKLTTWKRRVIDDTGEATDEEIEPVPSASDTVAMIMTRTTYCVGPEVPIETVVGLMLERHLSGVPVIDGDGRPIGIVSKTDVLRHAHESGDGVEEVASAGRRVDGTLGEGFHATEVHGTPVHEIMMPVVFVIEQDTTITAACALMAAEGVHRLPVVSADGRVTGILSTLDVVRWVAASVG